MAKYAGRTEPVGAKQPRPFLKWAGGKRALIKDISRLSPEFSGTYWEPFLGGGAVFLALSSSLEVARLSDINDQLILTYMMVRDRTSEVIDRLLEHASFHDDQQYYYEIRDQQNLSNPIEVATRFIYLNKTCYNGLYRVNKEGDFNVPRGNYVRPNICDKDNLLAVSQTLQQVDLKVKSFEKLEPQRDDFIYCDPPYHGTFTNYSCNGFDDEDQIRLRDCAFSWAALGAYVMISNADTPLIRDIYRGFTFNQVMAPRSINSNGNGRSAVPELIITSY